MINSCEVLRRADMFEWAKPKADDFRGRATAEELARADERCREVAEACRAHAAMLEAGWLE